jgi:hypothetical protein
MGGFAIDICTLQNIYCLHILDMNLIFTWLEAGAQLMQYFVNYRQLRVGKCEILAPAMQQVIVSGSGDVTITDLLVL